MPPHSWFSLNILVAAGIALALAVAVGFLWRTLTRQLRKVREVFEQRHRGLAARIRVLEDRLASGGPDEVSAGRAPGLAAARAASIRTSLRADRASMPGSSGEPPSREPALIVIPELAPVPNDGAGSASELKARHALIWELAEKGASPEMIARTTGQPIGQVELILGLRRRIDASKFPPPREPR